MELHEKISQVREAKKISRAEMATALNMSSQSYWNVETGKTELTVSRLNQIAELLGVGVIELLTGEAQKVGDSEEVERLKEKIKELESDKAYLQSSIDFLEEDKEFNRNFLKDIVKKLGSYIADVKDSNYTELLNDPEFKGLEYTVNFLTEMFKFIKEKPE